MVSGTLELKRKITNITIKLQCAVKNDPRERERERVREGEREREREIAARPSPTAAAKQCNR